MIPRPKEVKALENFCLQVFFENGETKIYDMSALIEKPFYSKLKNLSLFNSVKVSDITLEWVTGQDICPDELYNNSRSVCQGCVPREQIVDIHLANPAE